MTISLGAILRPQLPPERLKSAARLADEAGLDELWLWEDCFLQGGLTAAAAALAWTDRIRIGVGLLPVPLRNVALTAMETAALHRMFPGRVSLAIGHGVQDWMAQVGARPDSPLTLLTEYTGALRALLDGERVTREGTYVTLDDVSLGWPPAAPAEILIGGIGPRTLRLAARIADGTVLNESATPDRVREIRAAAKTGHRVVVYVFAATGEDAAPRLARELEKQHLTGVGVAGDAQTVAAEVRRYAEAGADSVVLLPTPDDPDPEGFLRFTAQEVRPLVP
ncbi:LLM class flavin-dependent oxidoreductase [Streptomyces niveiscabiei]|uniref:LLM class flavin-dependent oxidoreductase n=1 Tax=Streptomyces niveiscabiei TaxID=164115 RepID=UPI0029A56880|nr:LLM class flavin-dependent oxidoreductase [Streptomyces niveiscabiei]MDX3386516.1 LLM class flavin-dependent oxidoreductase [Streptomyces niveiscabiei]